MRVNVAVVALVSSMLGVALGAPRGLVLAASAAAPMKSADVVGA
jgi:hypothetical protein